MKPLAKYFLFTFFSVISFASIAQDTNPVVPPANSGDDSPPETKQYYLLSPRVSVTVPHPMLIKSFKKSFVGIY
ncbi:MAG: hypothetical protein ACXVED_19900, partial [Bacteroidia bacterium]